jgi:putative proteasome-type protease
MRVREGLIALSDGRVTAGSQMASARKMIMLGEEGERFFVMTSGLRSVRDKALAYLRREPTAREHGFGSMLEAVGVFSRCLRRVWEEDAEALAASELQFNLHALIGGRLPDDDQPTIFLVYPQGNWIEVDERTPYLSIGATAYGKPILDRALKYDTAMRHALKLAYLSFDSTRFSSTDVGYPIDVTTYLNADGRWRETHFEYEDLVEQRQWWNREITALAERMPDGPWVDTLLPPGQRLSLVRDED